VSAADFSREALLEELVARILEESPGLSAREIESVIGRGSKVVVHKSKINSLLYANAQRFYKIGESPPRWFLVPNSTEAPSLGEVPPNQPGNLHGGSPRRDLYAWQSEALAAWEANERRGIVEAVTAAGKTRVGLVAIEQALSEGSFAAVLVPSIELLHQWKRELVANLGAGVPIGLLGGGKTDLLGGHRVLVAVINSARDRWLGLPEGRSGLLVADEVHRFASTQNRLGLEEGFDRRLGLSATLERPDDLHEEVLLPYFDKVVFDIGYQRATRDGVIARVRVALVGVELLPAERTKYDELSEKIKSQTGRLINEFGAPSPRDNYQKFHLYVTRLSNHGTRSEGIAAGAYLKAVTERRKVLAETPNKLDALESLVNALAQSDRTIVFTSTIDSCESIVERLQLLGFTAASHHSGIEKKERARRLADFESGVLKVIVTAHTLEEGIDVPAADLGIIFGGSKQRREMVQRLGRVLRLKPDGRDARFVVLYVEETSEDPKQGYQEVFIKEMVGIAREVESFNSGDSLEDITNFLAP